MAAPSAPHRPSDVPPFVDPRIRGGAGYPETAPQNATAGQRFAVGKDPTVALLLSLFLSPVGQFYNGDIKKALAIIAGYVVGGILAFVYIGGFLILGLWIWSFIDAYNVAKQKTPLW
jgi:TM2 domain-containing membrane protein YozV